MEYIIKTVKNGKDFFMQDFARRQGLFEAVWSENKFTAARFGSMASAEYINKRGIDCSIVEYVQQRPSSISWCER